MCWNNPYPLAAATVRHDHYARGFERLGHEVTLVCLAAAAKGLPRNVVRFPAPDDVRQPGFWRRIRPDVLVMVTWLQLADELAAGRGADCKTVALADSDGQVGFRGHWRHTLYRSVMQHVRLRDRVAAAKFYARRFAQRSREAAVIIRSIEVSDRVVVNTRVAAANVRRFLLEEERADLASRVVVVPYPVGEAFTSSPLLEGKRDSVIAVGRWDTRQKNASFLLQSLDRYYGRGGTTETQVFGSGGEVFRSLAERGFPVVCHGVRSPGAVAAAMAEARALLLTSRWESGPIVAFEALSQGCTLISTDIPNARELVAAGCFGQIANSVPAYATAIKEEMKRWSAGDRNPASIAAQWRPLCSIDAVCRQILSTLE